jgi:hypothetical protein
VSGPRNRKAFELGRERRAAIKALWLELQPTPLHWTPTAERIRDLLPFAMSVQGVRWHMEQIRLEVSQAPRQCINPVGAPRVRNDAQQVRQDSQLTEIADKASEVHGLPRSAPP